MNCDKVCLLILVYEIYFLRLTFYSFNPLRWQLIDGP